MIVDGLVADLRRLGVCRGDVMMLHVSLRAVGPVEGGAAGLLAALDRTVGETGSLLMVLGAGDNWSWVNGRRAIAQQRRHRPAAGRGK